MGFAVECDLTITTADVKLVSDVVNICDGGFLDYEVEGYSPDLYEFAFNYSPNGPVGQFSANSLFTTQENSTFTVNVKEVATGCISNMVTVTAPNVEPFVTTTPGVQNVLCNGGQGKITINWTGGPGALTYYVVPAANFSLPIVNLDSYKKSTWQVGVPVGTYYVAVQKATLCADLDVAGTWKEAIVTQPDAIVLAPFEDVVNITCFGAADGKYNIRNNISGGTAPFTASINGADWIPMNAQAGSPYDFTGLTPGDYTVTVRDANGCTLTRAFVITEPEMIIYNIAVVDVDCNGANNGQITVSNVTGGTGAYSYSLDGDDFTNTTGIFPGLAPDSYSLWVKDVNGCKVAYQNPNNSLNEIVVQSPDVIAYTVTSPATPICNGAEGTITISDVTGGSGEYEYAVFEDGVWGPFGPTNSWLEEAGTYNVKVKDKNTADCEIVYTEFTITESDAVSIPDLVITSAPTCFDAADGLITITAAGGNGVYQYSIDNINWYDNNVFTVTSGSYTAYVKDSKGCGAVSMASQSDVVVETLDPSKISITASTDETCNLSDDGTINVILDSWAAGRTVELYYSTSASEVFNNGIKVSTTFPYTFTGLVAGDYYIWAKDELGCTASAGMVTILQPALFTLESSSVTADAGCFGSNDGVLTIVVNSGAVNPQYAIANTLAALESATYNDFQGSSTLNIQTGAGTYYVKVKDECGVEYIDEPFVINENDIFAFSATATMVNNIDCNGDAKGSITLPVATGGTLSYSYTLINGATEVATEDTPDFTGLIAGTEYSVIATDNGGCGAITVGPYTITEPSEVTSTIAKIQDIKCNGANNGVIKITAAGGSAGAYEFQIGATEWQAMPAAVAGTSTKNIVVTGAGSYVVKVRDTKLCKTITHTAIDVAEPTAIAATLINTDVSTACVAIPDGSIEIEVAGGVTAGEYEVSIDGSTWVSTVAGKYKFELLAAGTYTLLAKDDNDCVKTFQTTITKPDLIGFMAAVTANVSCNGSNEGVISVTEITGGTAPYNVTVNATTEAAVDGAATFSGLIAGTYTAVVTDVNMCSFTIDNLVVTEPTLLVLKATQLNDIGCTITGKFKLDVTGGAGTYVYYWAKSDPTTGHVLLADMPSAGTVWSTSPNAEVTVGGTYIVWAKDANNCMIGGEGDGTPVDEWRVQINSDVEAITYKTTIVNATCNAGEGSITVSDIKGGQNKPYIVTIDGVAVTESTIVENTFTLNLVAGSYTVKVTDDVADCPLSTTILVNEPAVVAVSLKKAEGSFTCPDAIEGYFEATATGGVNGTTYSYQLLQDGSVFVDWQTDNSFLVQIDHTYQVKVKTTEACMPYNVSNEVVMNRVLPITTTFSETTCFSDNSASVVVKAEGEAGRTFAVRYRLNTGSFGPWLDLDVNNEISIQDLIFANITENEDFYYFQVKDSEGCMTTEFNKSFVPTQNLLEVTAVQSKDQLTASFSIVGGISPYSYKVGNDAMINLPAGINTIQDVELTVPGTDVTVYDAHGCMATKSLVVAPLTFTAVPGTGNNQANAFDVVLTFDRIVTIAAEDITGGTFTPGTGTTFTVAMTGDDLTTVKLELGNGIADAAGITIVATTFTYKIGEHVLPTLVVTAPDAPVSTVFNIGLKFSEPVSGLVFGGSAVTVTGGKIVDITGTNDTYTLVVAALERTEVTIILNDAIVDNSNNKFAGETLVYTTGDFTAPLLVTKTPTNDNVQADNHPTFKFTLSEDVVLGAGGDLVVFKLNTTDAVLTIPITAAMIVGNEVTVNYTTTGLDLNTRYYVFVDGSALEDAAGNKFAGVSDVATWTFKTGPLTGTEITPNSSEFKVYPSPFVDVVNLVSPSKLSKVVVTNIAGQVVKEVVNPANSIQLNELRSGIYFISLYNMDDVIAKTCKIVKR